LIINIKRPDRKMLCPRPLHQMTRSRRVLPNL